MNADALERQRAALRLLDSAAGQLEASREVHVKLQQAVQELESLLQWVATLPPESVTP